MPNLTAEQWLQKLNDASAAIRDARMAETAAISLERRTELCAEWEHAQRCYENVLMCAKIAAV